MASREFTSRPTPGQAGFTLVELLVVMLILALMAAIAIPAFFNQAKKARDADAKADVRTAETAIEVYGTDNDGRYTGADVVELRKIEPTLNDANLTVDLATADTFQVTTDSATGNRFHIARASGILNLTCETADTAGCPSDGTWG